MSVLLEMPVTDPVLEEQIVAKRREGWTLEQIARQLNEDGIPTPQGGSTWRKSSLHPLMVRHGLAGTVKRLGKKGLLDAKS